MAFYQFFQFTLLICSYKVLNTSLSSRDFGLYNTYILYFLLASQIPTLGLEIFYQKISSKKDKVFLINELKKYFVYVFFNCIIITSLFYTLAILFDKLPISIMMIASTGTIVSLFNISTFILKGFEELSLVRLLLLVDSAFILICAIIYHKLNLELMSLIILITIFKVIISIFVFLLIVKKIINIPNSNTIKNDDIFSLNIEKKEYFKLGIFNIISSRSDKIILSAIDPLFVGFLAAINSVVLSIRNNLKSVLEWYTVRFVSMDIKDAHVYGKRLIVLFLLISFACVISTFIFAQDYIDYIFGKDYSDVVFPILLGSFTFPLLVLGFILKVFDQLVRSGVLARKVSYIKQITNLIFCLLLIPKYSYLSPVISLLISELLMTVYLIYNHFFQRRWII